IAGWVKNANLQVNVESSLKKYCFTSWIDESDGITSQKEKYMPSQNVELIRYVFAFDENSKMIQQKQYTYSASEKTDILRIIERNQANLLLDSHNKHPFVKLALENNIHCKINEISY
ncbi:MAG: hypothetical protein J6I64_01580, partial [Lachnospiraceae bacterium]|nr:hypothetical protein [Lachnospiraceae bacterium]